jgi:regulator of replication initiation timing
MNTTRYFSAVLSGAVFIFFLAGCGGGDAQKLQAENEALRAEVEALRARATTPEADAAREAELKRLQAASQDAARLRGEVTQLRTTAKDAEKLRAENQQLKLENQKLRGATAAVEPAPAAPQTAPGNIPRDSWNYAGYATPEAALISAIFSMQQGNPKQYFDSLTPEEQLRMTKLWENKTPEEIAAKHVSDTSKITGLKVVNQTTTADGVVSMNVQIEGTDRTETVVMKRVGNDWKFDGFKREPARP